MGPSTYIFAFAMLSAVYAAPPVEKKPGEVVILEQENNFNGVDPWRWSNVTNNNQSSELSGDQKDGEESVKLPESYIWTSPQGIIYNVTYVEDEELGHVPVVTQIGEGGVPSEPGQGPAGQPGDAGIPGRQHLYGNAALKLIGR